VPAETSILIANGPLLADAIKLYYWQEEHESPAEFHGRLLCEVEDQLREMHYTRTGEVLDAVPAGMRWAEWNLDSPHQLGEYYTTGLGVIYEHTGKRFTHRVRRVPGVFDEQGALDALNNTGGTNVR
jgi:hypothetical protein